MRASAGAACAVLLGGCLIVRTEEEIVDDPCPTSAPELLADGTGPLAISGDIYFVGANDLLSRIAPSGGRPSELTTDPVHPFSLAADASGLYWATEDAILYKPPDAVPRTLATGYVGIRSVVVDDTSVVWTSETGLDRWSKADETVSHLDDASPVFGLGASNGMYYYSLIGAGVIRRAPPIEDLATARSPGPLVVDEGGIYFYDVDDPFAELGGALRLVPRDGGAVVTTAEDISLIHDLATDADNVYFVTAYGSEYRIKKVSRFGGKVETLACGRNDSTQLFLEQLDDYVYWTDAHGLYRVREQR